MSAGAGSKFPSKDGEPYPSCSRPMRVTIPSSRPRRGERRPVPVPSGHTSVRAIRPVHRTSLKSGWPGNSNERIA